MRSTNILGLIIFSATFTFSSFIALLFGAPTISDVPPVVTYQVRTGNFGVKNKMGGKIEQFLLQDKRNGYERTDSGDYSDDVSDLPIRAQSVSKYAAKSGSMDASDFPKDFRSAWEIHMKAWSKYAQFLKNEDRKSEVSEDFEQQADEYVSDINSSWQDVLSVGREYGANLPAGF